MLRRRADTSTRTLHPTGLSQSISYLPGHLHVETGFSNLLCQCFWQSSANHGHSLLFWRQPGPHRPRGSQRPGPRPVRGCRCILTPAQDGRREDAWRGCLSNLTTRPFFVPWRLLLKRPYRGTLSLQEAGMSNRERQLAPFHVASNNFHRRRGYMAENCRSSKAKTTSSKTPGPRCIQVARHPPSRRHEGVPPRKSATAASRLHQSPLPSPPASIA